MKAYALDLCQRAAKLLKDGDSPMEAARRFGLGRRTVYRHLATPNAARSLTTTELAERAGCWLRLFAGLLA